MELSERQKEIALILIKCARAKKTICFSELMASVQSGRSKIGKELSAVGQKCNELKLPILTVLVVYKGTNITGYGFINEFFRNEVGKGRDREICEKCKNEAFNWNNWGALIDYINKDIDLDLVDDITATEGEMQKYNGTHRTRSAFLRKECLNKKGSECVICGFNAAKVYGERFAGKIHVHHSKALNSGKRESPVNDLYPVCPNCHMILHSNNSKEPFTIEAVKEFIKGQKIGK